MTEVIEVLRMIEPQVQSLDFEVGYLCGMNIISVFCISFHQMMFWSLFLLGVSFQRISTVGTGPIFMEHRTGAIFD